MTGHGFEPILTNKIKGFLYISTDYLKYHKKVRTTLELKMYLILNQKRAFMLVFVILLAYRDSFRTFLTKANN